MSALPTGYRLRLGSGKDRYLLLDFFHRTYRELLPEQSERFHLAETVRQYFSDDTPFWIVEREGKAIACLWMGNAIDQSSGERYGHIFLLYVALECRRQGIATALIERAREWAGGRGQKQIGLQVFTSNQNAISLYRKLGFETRSLLMIERFRS
jgi:ribosomal protein S18 acetylase RimI-like enzyme